MKPLLLCLALLAPLPAATHYITVAGLGGEPDYEARFNGLAQDIQKLLAGAPGATVVTLSGAQATRANLEAALQKVTAAAKSDDVLVLTLIGHGTFDGHAYKFNLPGPDLSAADLRLWLDRIPARQVVVNASSSSGGAIEALKKEGRVIISATRSGTERNATVFARYWVEALRDAAADTDKNETISALEAYRFADQKTARFYETQKRLATEHAVLEDTGKAEAVRAPSPDNGQGLLAARTPVLRVGAAQAALRDPAKQALLSRKEDIEQQIDKLKYEKAAMPLNEYRSRLQALLLNLAQIQQELDK